MSTAPSRLGRWLAVVLLAAAFAPAAVAAEPLPGGAVQGSLSGRSLAWPSWETVRRVVLLEDYNVRVVVFGATLLGLAAGMVGSFTLLRKRALMGDALSHAALPGIAAAFLAAAAWGGEGKSLAVLLAGATVSGLLGVGAILLLVRTTRLKEDAALCIVLSVFFGAGVALLSVAQQTGGGNAAGLESFIYGKTASMGRTDVQFIVGAGALCALACLALFKEFKLLCFDDGFAGARGYPTAALDMALMAAVVVVTIVGLQAVGLILMVALLITPPAAARFWTNRLGPMFVASAAIGAASGGLGAIVSALFSRLPSGPMIVLAGTAIFLFSLLFGASRGALVRVRKRRALNRSVDRQRLLFALHSAGAGGAGEDQLERDLDWTSGRLGRALGRAVAAGFAERTDGRVRLTKPGETEAARVLRQRRLWELYLETQADAAPGRVDRAADAIGDVLEPEVVAELESLLDGSVAHAPDAAPDLTHLNREPGAAR
ncbi:metal ABC transporter permease [Alienimonas californiensis]|uniref:Manganese transport system membrane protein MntB n=1 Tax=Alienimonas californiensis TaxID=2527989 RepID=A0A517P5J3_9PLAN|nr:iron chelate uptake ABC transporter family permease subunit [Alienimonas californiensis]QDT14626.1 Manganese transport system membrane protein MntB [Alienimonas californiensis]